jgi:hypothetical protein
MRVEQGFVAGAASPSVLDREFARSPAQACRVISKFSVVGQFGKRRGANASTKVGASREALNTEPSAVAPDATGY